MSRASDVQIAAWNDMRPNVIPRAGAFGDVLDALIAERRECESRPTVQPQWAVSYMGNDPEWLAWGCCPADERGHAGHIVHGHASHGNMYRCSCGEGRGVFSAVLTGAEDDYDPPPCPLCPPTGSTP